MPRGKWSPLGTSRHKWTQVYTSGHDFGAQTCVTWAHIGAPKSFAYQPGKSSKMVLSRLVRQVEKNFSDGEVMIAIFLDIQVHLTTLALDLF